MRTRPPGRGARRHRPGPDRLARQLDRRNRRLRGRHRRAPRRAAGPIRHHRDRHRRSRAVGPSPDRHRSALRRRARCAQRRGRGRRGAGPPRRRGTRHPPRGPRPVPPGALMREALAFLTVVGRPTTPTPRAWRWFPVVGAAIGAAVGSVWWLADHAFPVLLAAALTVAFDLAITGLLHVDGLADAADGLLPHASRDRRLEIMRTPGIGAFGAAVLGVTLVARTAALAARP